MFSFVENSINFFFKNILECSLQKTENIYLDTYYSSSIFLQDEKNKYCFYFNFDKKCLDILSLKLLCEDHLNDELICDLCKEVSNQIIGNAKNVFSNCKISIPEYNGLNYKKNYDEIKFYKIDDSYFFVGMVVNKNE